MTRDLAIEIERANAQERRQIEGLEVAKRSLWYSRAQFCIAVLVGMVLPVVIYAYSAMRGRLDELRTAQRETQVAVQNVSQQIERVGGAPVIQSPAPRSSVGFRPLVTGRTPRLGWNHYLVVMPSEIGEYFVQNLPITVAPDGSFRGQAQLGEGNNGIGKSFVITVLATHAQLVPGRLTAFPFDAVFSGELTVTRAD
jgi:hypothetical protein